MQTHLLIGDGVQHVSHRSGVLVARRSLPRPAAFNDKTSVPTTIVNEGIRA